MKADELQSLKKSSMGAQTQVDSESKKAKPMSSALDKAVHFWLHSMTLSASKLLILQGLSGTGHSNIRVLWQLDTYRHC